MLIDNQYQMFLFASTVMALGIGIDAAIATLVRARHFTTGKQAALWIAGVSATHTLFPMLGYGLAYISVQHLPVLAPLVGIVACLLVAHFLYAELSQQGEQTHSMNSWVHLGLILAVSWDALWSGPAKSAQVLGWSDWMIWLSFVWVGLLVSALCMGSFYLGLKAQRLVQERASILSIVTWLQLSVVGYFGLLALVRYTFEWQLHAVIVFILSGCMVYIMQWRQRLTSSVPA